MKLNIDITKHQIYGIVPFKLSEILKEDINQLVIFGR